LTLEDVAKLAVAEKDQATELPSAAGGLPFSQFHLETEKGKRKS